jgi:hypothetical protein
VGEQARDWKSDNDYWIKHGSNSFDSRTFEHGSDDFERDARATDGRARIVAWISCAWKEIAVGLASEEDAAQWTCQSEHEQQRWSGSAARQVNSLHSRRRRRRAHSDCPNSSYDRMKAKD